MYLKLIEVLRQNRSMAVDGTGWKVGGHMAWPWVFTDTAVTVYLIDPTQAHEVVERVLGDDFAGVVVCDSFLANDPLRGAHCGAGRSSKLNARVPRPAYGWLWPRQH